MMNIHHLVLQGSAGSQRDCLQTPGGMNGVEEEDIGTDEFQLNGIASEWSLGGEEVMVN